MSKKTQPKSQVNVNQAGNPSPKTKAEFQALLDAYAEQSPEKWERKKAGLLKKLEAMSD